MNLESDMFLFCEKVKKVLKKENQFQIQPINDV